MNINLLIESKHRVMCVVCKHKDKLYMIEPTRASSCDALCRYRVLSLEVCSYVWYSSMTCGELRAYYRTTLIRWYVFNAGVLQ